MIWDNLKILSKSVLVRKEETISAIRNTVIHDAENLGLVPIYEAKSAKESTMFQLPIREAKSAKESTMDQELDICNRLYEIAKNNVRSVCVTNKKYRKNKPSYIQIRLFTAKENEAMKQVAYVNYTVSR